MLAFVNYSGEKKLYFFLFFCDFLLDNVICVWYKIISREANRLADFGSERKKPFLILKGL